MTYRKVALGLVVSGLATVLAAGMAFAQAGGGGGGGGFGGGGGRPRFNIMDNIKGQLGATDDEWTVLQPKLQKVVDLSRELRAGGMAAMFGGGRGGRGGRGGNGGGGGDNAPGAPPAPPAPPAQPPSEIADKTKVLNDALDKPDSDPKDIAKDLADLRAAREKVKADLVAAQGELKEVLTPRQEARLALMGILD
jgi:hypothetical protein